jgi:type IV pilus assembly protein PilY1
MARRIGLPLVPVLLLAAFFTAVTLVVHQAVGTAQQSSGLGATACTGDLNRNTYTNGFQPADFSTTTAASILPGVGIQLDTALSPLNPENIKLPFDQDVRVKSVYNNAGATHSLGWFYLDQLVPTYYDPVANKLVDANNDGVPDLYNALYGASTNPPKLLDSGTSYSDGGNYPHIPNLLEPAPYGIGHIIFDLMNDNSATGWTFTYNGVNLPPRQDTSSSVDGIFDYDVNGDGTVGNEPDRTVDLGIIQGNREVVFFMVVYFNQTGKATAYGRNATGTLNSGITVHFSKTVLNTDQGGATANDTISYIDIGAPGVKSTGNVCEKAFAATTANGVPTPRVGTTVACGGTPYPSNVSNDARNQTLVYGWLSQTAINRLAGLDTSMSNPHVYGDLVLPHEVHRVTAGPAGTAPHYFLGAPSNDQNRWIIGFEDLLGYTASSCSACTQSDFSLEDVVLLIERSNGGQVVSQNVASDIPAGQLTNTVISRIRVRYAVTLPASCSGDASAGVQLYYSVNGGVTWRAVPMSTIPPAPSTASGDVIVDVLANGDVGNTLQWKAVFTSSTQTCQPQLNSMNIGYEAVQHGEYKFAAPIPLSNVVYSGTLETPLSTWVTTRDDFSMRGHFYATELFDPARLTDVNAPALWDAGAKLAGRNPDTRYVFTNNGNSTTPGAISLTAANGTSNITVAGTANTIYKQLLPSAIRNTQNSGKYVYDYNGDGTVDDTDAKFVLQWTRGWEFPTGITFTPAPGTQPQQRAWPLGPVHQSSPALVGPPGHPAWLDANGPGISGYATAFNSFQSTNRARKTLAIVGAQDGMLHGFNAGSFRQSPDAACAVNLARGCFANTPPDYGDGSETWAYAPPRLLSSLKNNHPTVRNYQPTSNPIAEVDGSVSAEDIYVGASFTTGVFATMGKNQPYISALRIDSDPTNPQPLWADDFTDSDYQGSNFSPGVVPWAQTPTGPKPLVVVSSGQADSSPVKSYLYLIDAATGKLLKNGGGTTIGKVALDSVGTSLGIAGYPNIVDANQDGIADRVYVADTSGRVYKVDLTTSTPTACVIASVGESVFAGMAVSVIGATTTPKVRIYLGGGPNPDGSSNPALVSPYHLFGFEDDDNVGTCTGVNTHLVFKYTIPAPGKLWAAPAIVGGSPSGNVYFATAGGASESVCDTSGGSLIPLGFDGDGAGGGVVTGPIASLQGDAVSSIRVYDGHALVNSVGGKTSIVGKANTWNNTPVSTGASGNLGFGTVNWMEY